MCENLINKPNNHSLAKSVCNLLQTLGLRSLAELETVMGEIKRLQISQEASVRSLQGTYKEHAAFIIERMRVNINTTLDECGNVSVSTTDANEPYLKDEFCRSVLVIFNEFDIGTVNELNEMKDKDISIKSSITSYIHKFNGIQNDTNNTIP
ncbi:hypothetical protein DPMN_132201 [Dreissena polymorpha]|uniref:Uncharacterized protein n=1 Tax=Dreissena polymorpha TaxID=45954 RepID=A0A9D4JBV2_DREPO|nr:hypothetical protein DPMN_132201 [Dreissena polymorpha]